MEMKLHIGCGARIEPGWENIDLSGPLPVRCLDVRYGLPYPDKSVQYIYCEHFLAHLTLAEGMAFLAECARVLMLDGVLRISVPSLRQLVDMYVKGNTKFAEVVGWLPATPCDMLNEGMRSWGHQYMYDAEKLREVLVAAGFTLVMPMEYAKTDILEMLTEGRPNLGELIFEALR